MRARPALLGAVGEGVLIGAAYVKFFGYVFGGFGHGVHAVFAFHRRIDEAPPDRRVEGFVGAAEGAVGFGGDEGSAGHAFYAAGDHEVGFAGAYGASGCAGGVHAGAAEAIDGGAGDFLWQAGEKQSHPGYVAIIFAGLIGAAVDDVVEGGPICCGIAGDQGADRDGGEIVGADCGEGAAVAAEGSANGIADEDFVHFISIAERWGWVRAVKEPVRLASGVRVPHI